MGSWLLRGEVDTRIATNAHLRKYFSPGYAIHECEMASGNSFMPCDETDETDETARHQHTEVPESSISKCAASGAASSGQALNELSISFSDSIRNGKSYIGYCTGSSNARFGQRWYLVPGIVDLKGRMH